MSHAIVQCPFCASGMRVAVEIAGQKIACPHCQEMVQIPPSLIEAVDPAQTFENRANLQTELPSERLTANCQECDQVMGITHEMIGQQVSCPICHQITIVQVRDDVLNGGIDTLTEREQESNEFDEAELFAPGFTPADHEMNSPDGKGKDSVPSFEDTGSRSDSSFELKSIPHPALPPVYKASVEELAENASKTTWTDSDHIILPAAEGGTRIIKRDLVSVRTGTGGRVLIQTTPKEKKEVRSRIRSLIVYAFCAGLLILVMLALVWINSQ